MRLVPAWVVLAALLSSSLLARAEPLSDEAADAAVGEAVQPNGARPTVDAICRTLAAAAADNELPEEFFTRLIWQESRFDPAAVSPVGAQGIAQFLSLIHI